MTNKDGSVKTVAWSNISKHCPIPGWASWGIGMDVTGLKRAEEALRESEKKYGTLIENSLMGIFIHQDEKYVFVNDRFAEIHGYEPEELLGKDPMVLIPPHFREASRQIAARRLKGEPVPQRYEVERLRKDGKTIWCEMMAACVEYAGRPAIMGNIIDITERKLAEQALRQSEERYRTVLQASPDPVVVYDMEGKVIYTNPAFDQVFGWTLGELIGKRIGYVPEENRPETEEMIEKVRTGQNVSAVETCRYTKAGDIIDVSIRVATYVDRDGVPVGSVHTLRDITERKRLEARLRHAAKMQAIGTLAGGIAHDFNNLLMGIQGNVSLMSMDLTSDDPHHERLRNIERQVQSGARLTSHLLGYARKGKYEVRPVDLNRLVVEASETFGRTRKKITIQRQLAEDLFVIEADYGQIELVLFNLFINAADAMPDGGKLVLKTMNASHDDMTAKPYNPEPGAYVLLTVTDAGIGMDEKTQERIFDPFFTTKGMGRGTGLGLASVYGIIKSHGGYIDVVSRKGRGTTFSVYLPASAREVLKPVEGTDRVLAGSGTILLADDEEEVLNVGKEMLEAIGYQVLTATNGREAVEIYEKRKAEIDCVVLDMIMPDMGGGEAYDRMKDTDSHVKAILLSGYSIDGEATEIMERGCDGFIQKPFNVEQLSTALTEVLGKQ